MVLLSARAATANVLSRKHCFPYVNNHVLLVSSPLPLSRSQLFGPFLLQHSAGHFHREVRISEATVTVTSAIEKNENRGEKQMNWMTIRTHCAAQLIGVSAAARRSFESLSSRPRRSQIMTPNAAKMFIYTARICLSRLSQPNTETDALHKTLHQFSTRVRRVHERTTFIF